MRSKDLSIIYIALFYFIQKVMYINRSNVSVYFVTLTSYIQKKIIIINKYALIKLNKQIKNNKFNLIKLKLN